ncbi:MAG: hypothetical protein GY749_34125 [Desulfobacteraceae bacterium]|nr:hypothetical protein [Desulfobacteraceae bacterium]
MRSEKWEVGSGKWEVRSKSFISHFSLLTSHFSLPSLPNGIIFAVLKYRRF